MNIKPGQTIQYKHGEIKIMAISENWAMVRYKGAMPFCELVRVIENWINDHDRQLRAGDGREGEMSNLISINEAVKQGIERLRNPIWVTPEDHLKIDIIELEGGEKEPRPWAKLYCPFNLECNGKDPVELLLLFVDCDKAEWEPYAGVLPDSEEYKSRQESYKGVLKK